MKIFQIKGSRGYYFEPEKIGSVQFPGGFCIDPSDGTIYFSELFAKKSIKHHKLKNVQIIKIDATIPGLQGFLVSMLKA